MKIISKALAGILLSLFIGCGNSGKKANQHPTDSDKANSKALVKGAHLLEAHCLACHTPSTSTDNRIAAPMEAIKKHLPNNDQHALHAMSRQSRCRNTTKDI